MKLLMERFRRYKRLSEMASYEGNLGAEEVMKFYMSDETTDDDIESFEDFLKKDDNESAWKLLQRILGTDLVGIPHDEDDIVITIDDDRDLNEMSLRMDTLDDPFAEENSSTHPKQVRERMPRMKLLMERWRQYLEEVEDFPDIANSQEEIQKSLDYFYVCHSPQKGERQDLGSWKDYNLVMFDTPDGKHFYVVDSEDRAKAYIAVEPFRDSYAVGNVRKVKGVDFRIADVYEMLVDKFGSLYSDKAQTGVGREIWDRLKQNLKVEEIPTPEDGDKKRTQEIPTPEDGDEDGDEERTRLMATRSVG